MASRTKAPTVPPKDDATAIDRLDASRDELRAMAMERLGVTGQTDRALTPLRTLFKEHDVKWYPLVALGLLAIVDTFQRFAFGVLTPDIAQALGVGKGSIAGVIALQTVAVAIAPLFIAALTQRRARRALLSLSAAAVWTCAAVATGFVTQIWGLVAVLLIGGISASTVHALHPSMLFDIYPPQSRMRILSKYQSFDSAGNVIAPLLVAFLTTAVALTWRGTFITLGLLSAVVCTVAIRLRDPGFGRWDEHMIRNTVRARDRSAAGGAVAGEVPSEDVTLGFFEIARRLVMIPTVRRLLAGYAVLGVLIVPLQTFLFFFLDEKWDMDAGERALFFAGASAAAVVALNVFGPRAEMQFRRNPGSVVVIGGGILATGVFFVALAGMAPWLWLTLLLFGVAQAVLALLRPTIGPALLGVIPAYMRPHAAALIGIFVGGVGGTFGALFLSGIDRRFGVAAAMISLLVPGLIGAFLIASAARLVPKDLARMVDEVIEDEEIRRMAASGTHLPMIACRGIDFSYGQLQVLFGVDFVVDDGEMVALLGVNGAGKSTLLKVISGIGLPSAGSVRFRGNDITYLDAERRVGLGISQIPGGRAVFADLTVADNLRGLGYTLGRDKRRLEAAIDECFEVFPRLAERREQRAGTLSGGEQQMLGLTKAFILKPRLLLIDELSLGLAPIVVGRLLELVRRINAQGTAVVLIEQSVNVALALSDHAYFMEKGQIRFDGPSVQLRERDDLLRAVFLEGVDSRGGAS